MECLIPYQATVRNVIRQFLVGLIAIVSCFSIVVWVFQSCQLFSLDWSLDRFWGTKIAEYVVTFRHWPVIYHSFQCVFKLERLINLCLVVQSVQDNFRIFFLKNWCSYVDASFFLFPFQLPNSWRASGIGGVYLDWFRVMGCLIRPWIPVLRL